MEKTKVLALYCGDFAFEEDYLTKYLICNVCDMVLRNPMRLHSCGHTFCDKCILNDTCAACNQIYLDKQPDLTAANLVADSIVKCLAKDCPFRGTYEHYISTHKNSCKLKNYDGLESWMQKVKQSLDDPPYRPKQKKVTINCEEIEIRESVKPMNDNNSVLIEAASYFTKPSELQSLIIENRVNKKIDVESLYQINPQNLSKVMEQMKEKERPAARRCQYGKHCKLMLEEGGCPYIHPEKDPRRHYELEDWANIPVVRPPNCSMEPENEKQQRDKEDTQNFLKEFFPLIKPPERKREVEIVPAPHLKPQKSKKKIIEL